MILLDKSQMCRWHKENRKLSHYNDVIMTTMGSKITSLTVVYPAVYSDADQRKHQSSASLAFVWGIHRNRWIPCTKGQLRGKCFHLMTSSCTHVFWTMYNHGQKWCHLLQLHECLKGNIRFIKQFATDYTRIIPYTAYESSKTGRRVYVCYVW